VTKTFGMLWGYGGPGRTSTPSPSAWPAAGTPDPSKAASTTKWSNGRWSAAGPPLLRSGHCWPPRSSNRSEGSRIYPENVGQIRETAAPSRTGCASGRRPSSGRWRTQLGLERHGGRAPAGLWARIVQRLLALNPATWFNRQIGAPVKRSLIGYDHW